MYWNETNIKIKNFRWTTIPEIFVIFNGKMAFLEVLKHMGVIFVVEELWYLGLGNLSLTRQ